MPLVELLLSHSQLSDLLMALHITNKNQHEILVNQLSANFIKLKEIQKNILGMSFEYVLHVVYVIDYSVRKLFIC